MAKLRSSKRKSAAATRRVTRESATGRIVGLIDEHDAIEFRRANTAFMKDVAASKAKAIEALKESGFLTKAGNISKRYR